MMKTLTLLVLILFVLAISVFGQSDSATKESKPLRVKPDYKRHEINVGFTNLFQRNSFLEDILYYEYFDWDYYYDDDFYYYPFFFEGMGLNATRYGIGYRFHFKKSAVRSYFDFGINTNKDSRNSNGGSTSYPTKINREYLSKSQLLTSRLGYEFIITNNHTDFFFGLDAIFQSSKWNYDYNRVTTYYDQWNIPTGDYDTYESETTANYYAYGAGPIVGIGYHLNEMISISTETRIDITSYQQKGSGENSTFYSGGYPSTSKEDFSSRGLRTKVAPLGLFSLNVHL